ncbi:four-carbon acid sugar kinase family protein [Rosenbergiella epipactidis]|uniref:3-oxo-tetronate kinase n=1 Tax=Rosenbergiella epipactidis TaxID=1544694 RepID=UPI002026AECF|nr:3-oxo-tetronate kinase [Rosenbergiella epipactidis]MCL9669387.1 four-carbon acid sugar kinase family protein [Rosenbergiella epipactidis]
MQLGVIADDFTGATDIASFLVKNGMSATQLNGVPQKALTIDSDAVVISLKTRSCDPQLAIEQSLAALHWLQKQGCQQFYFKYCSTFDSTAKGNIGPVLDALLAALSEETTVISPALPVNGRTVYQGYLFVGHRLLSESGMRHHPVTPMTEANLQYLIAAQAQGKPGLIDYSIVEQGTEAVRQQLDVLTKTGINYIVLDALNEQHLLTQGEAVQGLKLVSGGSGLAIGIAQAWAKEQGGIKENSSAGVPVSGPAIVLSGSCSEMTNTQVKAYRQQAPAKSLDLAKCFADLDQYVTQISTWVREYANAPLAPLVYATTEPETLKQSQAIYGSKASSEIVERFFSCLAADLFKQGFKRFIVAGGETSSSVAQTLGVTAFHIGPVISPGVPWVRDTEQALSLALKSGNFGDENFFARAQQEFPV